MSKFKNLNSKKGITLIALIITIIVMLILVGVSVSILVETDLIGAAEKAGDAYKNAQEKEGSMGQITIGNTTYGSIEEYIQSVNKSWDVIYDAGGTTTGGQLLISDELVFDDGALYKITVESEEFTGTVIATSVLASAEENVEMYVLYLVENGKAITFSSAEEANEKLETLDSGTLCIGINATGEGSVIGFVTETMGAPSCEYKIVKVEKEAEKLKLIFEGEAELIDGVGEIPNLVLDKTKDYKVTGTADGTPFSVNLRPMGILNDMWYFMYLNGDQLFGLRNEWFNYFDCVYLTVL